MIRKYFIPILLLICGYAHATSLEVIHLRHQSAEEIIPIIRPIIGNDGVVTGSGYKLIVRVPPQRLEEIRQLLDEIDRPLQQLIISVRQNRQVSSQADTQGISGNIGSDKARLSVGKPVRSGGLNMRLRNGDDRLQVHLGKRNNEYSDDISQQVRTISGRPAYVSVGQSRPMPQQQTIVQGNRVIRTYTTEYHDATSGFYVTPTLRGDNVILEISTQRQQPGRRYHYIQSSHLSTTISGKLGQWISLGGADEVSNQSNSRLLQSRSSRTADLRNISVKVTLAE